MVRKKRNTAEKVFEMLKEKNWIDGRYSDFSTDDLMFDFGLGLIEAEKLAKMIDDYMDSLTK